MLYAYSALQSRYFYRTFRIENGEYFTWGSIILAHRNTAYGGVKVGALLSTNSDGLIKFHGVLTSTARPYRAEASVVVNSSLVVWGIAHGPGDYY